MANRRRNQSWDHFRYFLAVARTGTLSAAAAQLGTEHTTVARHIRSLEEELNNRLFHKSRSGYGLTAGGERLLATAEAIESAVVSAQSVAGSEGRAISGTVRIAAPEGFGTLFLAPRMRILTRRHPQLDIEILATPRLFSLSRREAEIAIGLSVPAQTRLVSRRITDVRLFVYASQAYLAEATPILSPADLKGHPMIGYVEEAMFTPELKYMNVIAADARPRIRSTNLLAQIHAVLGGGGLCILPAFVAPSYPTLVAVLPEQVSLTRAYHMLIHEDHQKAAHVRVVASFIAGEVERNAFLFRPPSGRRSQAS